MEKSIEDVKLFWDQNPLYTGEFDSIVGSKEWFEQVYRVKLKDCFCNDLRLWVPPRLSGKKVLDILLRVVSLPRCCCHNLRLCGGCRNRLW